MEEYICQRNLRLREAQSQSRHWRFFGAADNQIRSRVHERPNEGHAIVKKTKEFHDMFLLLLCETATRADPN
jgi:hypothetical protein